MVALAAVVVVTGNASWCDCEMSRAAEDVAETSAAALVEGEEEEEEEAEKDIISAEGTKPHSCLSIASSDAGAVDA